MAEESSSAEIGALASSSTQRPHGMTLRRKIAVTFSAIILLVGVLIVAIVYQFTGSALRAQVDQRAQAIATNFVDAAAGLVVGKNALELNVLITKYARLDGVAYVFIEDIKSNVIGSSLSSVPPELTPRPFQDLRQFHERSLSLRGRPIHEIRVPILEGRAGAAHVGMWGDLVEAQIQSILLPIISLVATAVLVGIILSIFLARTITRPLYGLVAVADGISKGNLDTPVSVDSDDEVGELARSLERMRASLKAAMARLNRA